MENIKKIGATAGRGEIFGSKNSQVAKVSNNMTKNSKSIIEGKLNSFQDRIYNIQREEEFLQKHTMAL